MERQRYQRRDHQQQRYYNQSNGQGVARYVTRVTPIGIMHTRIFDNSMFAQGHYVRPQLHDRMPSESDEGYDFPQYSFEDFPIDMDDTEVIVYGKYSVSLLQQTRFNVIFIRVRWAGYRDSVSMCAMITVGSPEYAIRQAVEECANVMERCDYLVRNGDRYPVSYCSIEYLNKHHIVVIEKVDENFPNAVYWCTLCDYHMSNIQHVRSHFEQHQHFADEQRMQERGDLIERMPQMTTHQMEAINSAIVHLFQCNSEIDPRGPVWQQRMDLMAVIEELFKRYVFEKMDVKGHVQVYGSTVTKTAIDCSDLNISIDIPNVDCSDAVETMKNVAELLNDAEKELETLDGFDAQFLAETPMCIRLTVSNVRVRITWRRDNGLKLATLLSTYAAVRPQYAELCRVVRKWAEICGIYSVGKRQGGLTSYAFDLMVLYFLQQKGLLPCLHEMRPMMAHEKKTPHMIDDYFERRDLYENDTVKIAEKFGKLEEPWNLALLFVEFLCFYGSRAHQNEVVQVITKAVLTRDKTRWSRKLLQIADPFRTDNVVTFTKAYQAYFFNCFLKSYLYFVIPQTAEGPLLDVTLYQKIGESPRKKKSKRKRGTNTAGNGDKKELKPSASERALPEFDFSPNIDIREAEYTAAADALVVDEEERAEINNKIMDNLMFTRCIIVVLAQEKFILQNSDHILPQLSRSKQEQPPRKRPVPKLLSPSNMVLDARVGCEGTHGAQEDQQRVNIACVNGLHLQGDEAENIMKQLVELTKAVAAGGDEDVILGCSVVDVPEKLCGSYMLPGGAAFFIPKRSACGFLVDKRWVTRVIDVTRLKRGLCEIILRLSPTHRLSVIYCLQLCDTYPLRRLQERVKELESVREASVVVFFGTGSTRTRDGAEVQLAEECGALGLDVWTGLFKEETRTFIATICRDNLKVDDLFVEEMENLPSVKTSHVIRAAVEMILEITAEPPEGNAEEISDAAEKIAHQMQNSRRKKEGKIRRAENRRQERERAAQLLKQFEEEEKAAIKKGSPEMQESEIAAAIDDLVSHMIESVASELESEVVTPTKSRRKRNRKKKSGIQAEGVNSFSQCPEEVASSTSSQSIMTPSRDSRDVCDREQSSTQDSCKTESPTLSIEDMMKTSLFHDIPLKDLNPENVEIDDFCVYSRRTMYRIRDYAPIRISRPSFALLERYCINSRDFTERDKEVDEMQNLRRQKIRNERMREKLRAKIGEPMNEEVEKVQNQMKEFDPFDTKAQIGKADEDWLPQVEIDDDDLPDTTLDSTSVTEPVENGNIAEEQQEKENQSKSLICYEDFFVTLKDFDPYSFKTKVDGLEKDCFTYSFDNAENFTNGYKPDMVCASCESSEHWSDACPLMTIPKVEVISHQKQQYEWVELDHVILGTYERNRVKEHRLEKLGEMVDKMRSFLEKELRRTVRLDIFGSLVNGLGAGSSDVDICFRFETDEPPLNVDGVEIVREISQSLQKMKGLDKVYAITGAKVPIVKFLCPKFSFEGDISYYNVLALYNTQLLKTYCAWDRRVAPVGIWVKRWAKSCDIGDASRGSLSSYAMIILLIHYLQNCEPPVLPRLQEDFRNGDVKPILVENHDIYYHDTVFEKWSENRLSVAQLFVGFLDYYARFDFETQVVQIRRKKPLLKMEKDWNRSVCIEDPFDLNHNLGSGVTKKMYVFIVRNIHNSRKRFTLSDIRREFLVKKETSLDKEMPPNLIDQYAAALLKECEMGSAPSDRQCRICHRVGHFAESCPKLDDEETRGADVTKDELVESDFRNQHGLRTPRREPWPKKALAGVGGDTPRGGYSSGRTNQGGRSFFRKVERLPRQNGQNGRPM